MLGKKEVAGFNEIQKYKDEQLMTLKIEVKDLTGELGETSSQLQKLTVEHTKVSEQYEIINSTHNEVVDKLRITNKVRFDLDVQLSDETNRVEYLTTQVQEKDDVIQRYWRDIDRLEKHNTDTERALD